MSDKAAYHIFMYHADWVEPYIGVADSPELAADIIGNTIKEKMCHTPVDEIRTEVIYGVPVDIKVRQKDICVVQLAEDKFLIGMEAKD